jgi:polysaccharide biosynthesis protein PslG
VSGGVPALLGRKDRHLHLARAAVVLAVAVALLLFAAGGSVVKEAPRLPVVGSQFQGHLSDYNDAQRAEVLDRLVEAGVQWVRLDVSWSDLQPDDGSTFSEQAASNVDDLLGMAQKRGLDVLATFWRTPEWANDDAGDTVPPTNPEDYGNAARWAAERFDDRVSAWEIWNEPNDTDFFAGADPGAYAALLRAGYRAFKGVTPRTPVLFGGLAFNDASWLDRAYAAGAGGNFDVLGAHPYQAVADLPPDAPDDGTEWRLTHVPSVRDVMVAHGDQDKDIWFTEVGWSSHPNTAPDTPHWSLGVTRAEQAEYLARTLRMVTTRYEYVTHVFWYRDRDASTGNAQLDNFGLLDRELQPKPVWHRLRQILASTG